MQIYIKFFDYWHISSGESAGVLYDATVLKDENGFAYIGGKTIKGLVKDAMKYIDDKYPLDEQVSNLELPVLTKKKIEKNKEFLYKKISSTAIDSDTKMAKDHSLRDIEVVIPITLYGTIEDIKDKDKILKALKLIKRVGLNRNRGLGRCEVGEYKDA
jgi:CRISPR/Cas system CMR subunit Cmr4 (Cas7 group RAMP superfamily)